MTALNQPDATGFGASEWTVSELGASVSPVIGFQRRKAGIERVGSADSVTAVVTPIDDVHELMTVLDGRLGVVTTGTFGRVVSHADAREPRLDVHMLADEPTTFSFAHNDVRLGDAAAVHFLDESVLASTALLTAEHGHDTVDVRCVGSAASALHDLHSVAVRAGVAGGATISAQFGGSATTLAVIDDLGVRVPRGDRAEVFTANGETVFRLDPCANLVELAGSAGTARVVAGTGVTIDCVRSGWRVLMTEWLVTVESDARGQRLLWDRATRQVIATEELRPGGPVTFWSDGGLRVDLGGGFVVEIADRVRIAWAGKDFVISTGRVVVADGHEDWYLSADGKLTTTRCVVSAEQAVDGHPEVSVRSVEHEWFATVWPTGAMVDHGGDLRTVLNADGAVSAHVARADNSVISKRGGVTVLASGHARVEVSGNGETRLSSGTAELRVEPRQADGVLRSTIDHDEFYSVVVTDSEADGLTCRTTHRRSLVSHLVRGSDELVVSNSPSGADIIATAEEVRVIPPGSGREQVITA
ncbi:hypothetical protein [Lentzea sp. NPDC004782]|uniref:hypothetical protein n=1 Tax=Lentzea sp. NPDC004782 TaxID=3154458 RepID=UPI0033AD01D4